MNNFKKLEDESLQEVPMPSEYIKERIVGQISNYRTFSSIVDLFVSVPFKLFTRMMSKEDNFSKLDERKPPHLS